MSKQTWMHEIGGIMRVKHVQPIIKAIKASAFHTDADKLAAIIQKDGTAEPNRRMLYQAVMQVSAGCPYFITVQQYNRLTQKNEDVEQTMYPTYSQTLQALVTQSPRHFMGQNITGVVVDPNNMKQKWELFRQGYFVARDTYYRNPYSNTLPPVDNNVVRYKNVCANAHDMFIRERNNNEFGITVVA